MKPSPVVKRCVVVNGAKTSVSLEEGFWCGMREIARETDKTLSELVSEISASRQHGNLSSAIRLFVLDHYRTRGPLPHARPAWARNGTSRAVRRRLNPRAPTVAADLVARPFEYLPLGARIEVQYR